MSNTWFRFKQFTVQQQHCAMKVCTDACLFGAIAANYPLQTTSNNQHQTTKLLDIGTGTGLLSLMYAQKNPSAIIDAIEIDMAAAAQAKENFDASPWKERLNIINSDILNLDPSKVYDFIISNPPFFEGDLRSANELKNNAKHDTSLSLQELINSIKLHLKPGGHFGVLLPFRRVTDFENLAVSAGFHLHKKIWVKQSQQHDHFRAILFFSEKPIVLSTAEISIRNSEGNYSAEFVDLLKDYYLNF